MKKTLLLMLSLSMASMVSAQIPTDSLIAYYPFDGDASDESGNGNHGTVNGATLTTDRFGNANSAYNFDGTNDFISVPSSASLQKPTYRFTLSAWVNVVDLTTRHYIIDKRMNKGQAPYTSYSILASTTGASAKWQATNQFNYTVTSQSIATATWTHIVALYDSTSVSIYINGSLISSTPSTATGPATYSNLPLFIGTAYDGTNGNTKGKIDDIRIYNRALSSGEISALFNESQPSSSIEIKEDNKITVFPNPVSSNLSIANNSSTNEYHINVCNSIGQTVYTGVINTSLTNVDVTTWPKGVYFIRFSDKNKLVKTEKIIVN